MRLIDVAAASGLNQASTHRALKALIVEGFVEQLTSSRKYRLALGFFVLAALVGLNPTAFAISPARRCCVSRLR